MQVLKHGQSDYVRELGMAVTPKPIVVEARILNPPRLRYGQTSAQPTIVCLMHNFKSRVEIQVTIIL